MSLRSNLLSSLLALGRAVERLSVLTLTRYAVAGDNTDPERPPLREVAVWVRPMAPDDRRIVQLAGYEGDWILQSSREPLVDLVAQHTKAVINRFGEIEDIGGQLLPDGSQDLYRLPLLDGYRLVTEDEYVDAWNQVCAPEQRIA